MMHDNLPTAAVAYIAVAYLEGVVEEAARSVEEALGELLALNIVYTCKENCYSESVITMMFYNGMYTTKVYFL